MATTRNTSKKTSNVGGINEIASALHTRPDVLTRMKQKGDFIEPIGTVSGRDAYDMAQATDWGRTHLQGATKTATRTTSATRMANTASKGRGRSTTGPAGGRRTRTR